MPRYQNSGIDAAVSVSDISDLEHLSEKSTSDLASEEFERNSESDYGCQGHECNDLQTRAPLLEMKIEKIFAITDDAVTFDSENAMVMDRADYLVMRYGKDKALLYAETSMLPSERNKSLSPTLQIIDEMGMQSI